MENVMTNGFTELSENEMFDVDGGREEGGMHNWVYNGFHAIGNAIAYTVGFVKDCGNGNLWKNWDAGCSFFD